MIHNWIVDRVEVTSWPCHRTFMHEHGAAQDPIHPRNQKRDTPLKGQGKVNGQGARSPAPCALLPVQGTGTKKGTHDHAAKQQLKKSKVLPFFFFRVRVREGGRGEESIFTWQIPSR